MVQRQLRDRGISDESVLAAMSNVPREEFVPTHVKHKAYDDCPLSIGFGQTISQPFTVAFQCEALCLSGQEQVLEVGTGCGYAAAVLSRLAGQVHTVERIGELVVRSSETFQRLSYTNVHVHASDGTLGLPAFAPFAAIVVTAGGKELPAPLLEQLAPSGRIVVPLGATQQGQAMFRFTKRHGELTVENLGGFSFVPLIGQFGWSEPEGNA